MFRFSQMGWYKSLSSNNASNNPQPPPTTTAGDNFTATSVVNGGAPDYIFNKDQQRIILNPIDADNNNNNNSNIEQAPPKKMTMLHQMGTRLGLLKKDGGEQRIKTVIVSQPMITMSQSSLAYDQLDDDETATTSSAATRQQAKTKSQRASLNDTVQKNKLKLKNIVASSDESDKEEILADNDEDSSVHNQDRIYLDLSPKVVANTRP